jgi:hypothetical protein
MSTHNDFPHDDDWTPDERALLASLPAERIPPTTLKARTTDSLRQRGLLRDRPRSPRPLIALLAAAGLIFIAGAAVGYVIAASRPKNAIADPGIATRQAVAQADSVAIKAQPVRHIVWY